MEFVRFTCDSYTIPDTDTISAELEIEAVDINGKKFSYGYGKSIEGGLCRGHLAKIQALIKNQDQVCITGDGENTLDTGEVFARWKALETRLGEVNW